MTPIQKLLDKSNETKNGILSSMQLNDKVTSSKIANKLAEMDESDDDEVDGRSVTQEIDYSNKKKAAEQIK